MDISILKEDESTRLVHQCRTCWGRESIGEHRVSCFKGGWWCHSPRLGIQKKKQDSFEHVEFPEMREKGMRV